MKVLALLLKGNPAHFAVVAVVGLIILGIYLLLKRRVIRRRVNQQESVGGVFDD
jgi:nitrate reductase gamma subunit